MTSNIYMRPLATQEQVDFSTAIRNLYLRRMVPTAQLCLAVGKVYQPLSAVHMPTPRTKTHLNNSAALFPHELREHFLHASLDALSLAHCEVQSWGDPTPENTAKLNAMGDALDEFFTHLAGILKSWANASGLTLAILLRHAISNGCVNPKGGFTGKLVVNDLAKILNTWPTSVFGKLFSAIEYTPEQRHSWLHARTRRNTPLMQDGQISRWRTLPANMPWTVTFERLDVTGLPDISRCFGSELGRLHAHARLSEVYPHLAEALAGKREAPVDPATPSPAPTSEVEQVDQGPLVPANVDVMRTPDGRLAVIAKKPRLGAKSVGDFRAYLVGSEKFKELATAREQQFITMPRMLEATMALAERWLAEQEQLEQQAQAAYEVFQRQQVYARVEAKLKTFSAEELLVLAERFTPPLPDERDSV